MKTNFTIDQLLDILEMSVSCENTELKKETRLLIKNYIFELDHTFIASIKDLCKANKKLEAVKLFKDKTGLSLMESKKEVERICG